MIQNGMSGVGGTRILGGTDMKELGSQAEPVETKDPGSQAEPVETKELDSWVEQGDGIGRLDWIEWTTSNTSQSLQRSKLTSPNPSSMDVASGSSSSSWQARTLYGEIGIWL